MTRRLLAGIAVAGLVVALGAAPAAAGGGNVKRFCKTAVKVDQVEEPSEKLLETWLNAAPPEIVETVDAAITQFQEQGEAAFQDDAFIVLLTEIDQFVLDNCGFEQVEVSMLDYAFDGVPNEIEKGTVAFTLTNEGTELHEFTIVRLKRDATVDDLLADRENGFDIAEGVAGPGETAVTFAQFKKTGRHVAFCITHSAAGMVAEFEVT